MSCHYLFVYGTLKKSSGSVWHDRLVAEHFTLVGPAEINALLFDLGDYPGITETGRDTAMVEGELYSFDSSRTSLSAIDQYEGCGPEDPEPPLYERKLTSTRTKDGKTYKAWCYFYLGNIDGLEPIGSSWVET